MVTINEPESLNLACTVTNDVSMPGGNDGSSDITFSGGTAPYTISWTGAMDGSQTENTATTVSLSNLIAGGYTITVEDANGCSLMCSFSISSPGCNLTLNISGQDESCPGEMDGLIELTILNGNGPFTF